MPHGQDFSAGLEHSAAARFLTSDEGNALSAWVGAAIAMVGMLLMACAIGMTAFLYQRHNRRSVLREVQKVTVKGTENGGKKPQAWQDPEVGAEQVSTVVDKASVVHDATVVPDKLSPNVRLELAETLRSILQDEMVQGLKASGIPDRLDRLEQQAREQQVLSGSLLPPPTLDTTLKPQTAQASSMSEWGATLKPVAPMPPVELRDAPPKPPVELCDATTLTEAEHFPQVQVSKPELSPSARQKRFADPPEKGWQHIDEERSARVSLVTVQRNLYKRDSQTQELHRQLRETQKDCISQKLEATHAVKRLQDLLADPSFAPQVQAEELRHLKCQVEDLSGSLADTKQSEVQWQIVAKRQRAFFMQSERVAQEGVNIFRKHPAGELFLAPPPVYLEDDVDEDPRKPPWDIGTSHINPYVNDSWPFEPNACAQRCAVEPNLSRWDEEDGDIAIESDSDDGSTSEADRERAQLMLRLPTLPPEGCPESPEQDDEDLSPMPPTEPPEPLPSLGALSSRSL